MNRLSSALEQSMNRLSAALAARAEVELSTEIDSPPGLSPLSPADARPSYPWE